MVSAGGGSLAVTAQQVKFGARLAHTEKDVRDAAVQQLGSFMAKQEQMAELALLKVWKGLFYCMWMADKVPIQNELAENLAEQLHYETDEDEEDEDDE